MTYKILPNLTAYVGYSEANRAPTPPELNCSSSTRPCILASTLISDPPLQQVVSHTLEAGLRGNLAIPAGGAITWKAGLYRTDSTNDIIQLASLVLGTGYFTNVPETLRQGVEAQASLSIGAFSAYINYGYVDATYQFAGTLSSPFNPFADANGIRAFRRSHSWHSPPAIKGRWRLCVHTGVQGRVRRAHRRQPILCWRRFEPKPAIAHVLGGQSPRYQINNTVQIFGLINNLLNNHYATYGTLFDQTTDARYSGNPVNFVSDPRTITPAQPIAFYGGVKVTF
jgi:iron complex outermembrane receptor protein